MDYGEGAPPDAVYAGVPAANRAFAVAQRVLAETEAESGDASGAE